MKKNEKEKLILVFYFNIEGDYLKLNNITKHLKKSLDSEIYDFFVVPTEGDNKIDCINPKLIDSNEFIKHLHKLEKAEQEFKKSIKNLNNVF
jgi:hypothetical protein